MPISSRWCFADAAEAQGIMGQEARVAGDASGGQAHSQGRSCCGLDREGRRVLSCRCCSNSICRAHAQLRRSFARDVLIPPQTAVSHLPRPGERQGLEVLSRQSEFVRCITLVWILQARFGA